MDLSQLVASAPDILPPLAALCHRQLPEFVVIYRRRGKVLSRFNFQLLAPTFTPDALFWPVMSEMAQTKRGGRAYHSVLEPHFDFIREERQRRKTWQEIANLLFTEKGIRVTFYAPYHFYRRKLKHAAKSHWENPTADSQPTRPSTSTNRPQSRSAPLPPAANFKRPNVSTTDTEVFT